MKTFTKENATPFLAATTLFISIVTIAHFFLG